MTNLDPWPNIERLATERGLDLAPLYEIRDRAVKDGRFIDAETAVGQTALLVVENGGSVDDAVRRVRDEIDAKLNEPK
jgi:hypothetical protein